MAKTPGAQSGRADRGKAESTSFHRATMIVGAAALSIELLLLAAIPAVAVTPGPDQVRVAHSDLDLASAADLAVLDLRVTAAARAACRDRVGDPVISYRRCVADTSALARSQVAEAVSRRRASISAASWSGLGVD